ncbi:MAG: ribosome silencing factor [Polyangiaceae bacterium]
MNAKAKKKAKKVSKRVTPPRRSAAPPPRPEPSEESKRIALLAARAGLDKKAVGVEIVDVTGKVDYADYLVLMTGHSDRHVGAIAEAVEALLRENGVRAISMEGLPQGNWVLIDFVDVVVHVFEEQSRSLYDLDGLWMDARRIPVPGSAEQRS